MTVIQRKVEITCGVNVERVAPKLYSPKSFDETANNQVISMLKITTWFEAL